jgi:ribosome biogenesis GTPase
MNIMNESDQGVVFRKSRGHYNVRSNGQEINCELQPRLHKQLSNLTADPIAIGDQVCFLHIGRGQGIITEICPRRSRFSRPLPIPGQRVFEQVIAANADQILFVFASASPTPKWTLLDRYLVIAEANGLPSHIIITKMDLADKNDSLEENLGIYRRIGYLVHLTCASTGKGIEELKQILCKRMSVLVGKSGVGKTSLLNALQPNPGLRIQAVSQGKTGKGKHTTSSPEMFDLDFGGSVIDTPGMREFGLWDIANTELAMLFPEMAVYVGQCKYGLSCQHIDEPDCAIRKAVMTRQISPYRYQSYLRLLEEL